ncbi:calcineurin-like phosphoesterase family protein [Bradyrhizobium japonicum USDA 38]|uniref:metallophosphoesterase family protein n=1 Tax=Bradyrhizobium japonicum TaxID=375 RepID=UPI0004298FE0|nr:metallophosphoesterase [Bradyrhizobium japonicum]MCS3893467.1 calcineurin-like phosphoesterase family protein [Bradyrhizobium japonicum USDA 38]MCS3945981.1 calcineurin-like phosphoesterase family protein [Bradyrhizobium japonicum]
MSTFFIADPHYFHASPDRADGIIGMCNRPFANGREMNEVMASSWRAVVQKDDDVICLGDFAHRAEPDALREMFDSLPGRKTLVIGNHDGPETRSLPWTDLKEIAYVNVETTKLVVCHFPMLSWPGSRKPSTLMLYGHHHGKIPGNRQSCDIGVDVMGWAPVRLSQIKAHMATLPPRVDPEAGGDLENAAKVKL